MILIELMTISFEAKLFFVLVIVSPCFDKYFIFDEIKTKNA